MLTSCNQPNLTSAGEKREKEYGFRRQFNEEPSIPGCPGHQQVLHRLIQAKPKRPEALWQFQIAHYTAVALAMLLDYVGRVC